MRWPSKEATKIAKAVERAGGTVERTGKGQMKVTGPKGVAYVASNPANNPFGRHMHNTLKTIEAKTGLSLEL